MLHVSDFDLIYQTSGNQETEHQKSKINPVHVMMNQSWVYTFVVQLCLCLAFYLAFQIGQPQSSNNKLQRSSLDFYFITVVTTPRPLQEQTLLLKQLDDVIKMYNVQFVINIGEYPLLMNVTTFLQQPEVSWSPTRSLKLRGPIYYQRKIDLPHGRTLDVTAINTKVFQDLQAPAQKNHFSWLTKMLKRSHNNWRIVVGYHSLVNCSVDSEKSDDVASEQLYHTLLHTGVNAYLSGQTCLTDLPKEGAEEIRPTYIVNRGPSFTSVNQELVQIRENVDGFLLHRINALEFISYLVNIKGEVTRRVALQPRGRESM